MPIRDVDRDSGSFAVAPGTHHRGSLHDTSLQGNAIPRDAIPDDAWRSADFRVGDVLIFNYLTAHTALPNPSNEIRMSLDVRAIPASAPQPVIGAVEKVQGAEVTIRTEEEGLVIWLARRIEPGTKFSALKGRLAPRFVISNETSPEYY